MKKDVWKLRWCMRKNQPKIHTLTHIRQEVSTDNLIKLSIGRRLKCWNVEMPKCHHNKLMNTSIVVFAFQCGDRGFCVVAHDWTAIWTLAEMILYSNAYSCLSLEDFSSSKYYDIESFRKNFTSNRTIYTHEISILWWL